MPTTSFNVNTMSYELEVQIKGSPMAVFTAITRDVQQWWGTPYLHRDDAMALSIEARLGGVFWEAWPDDGGAVWGHVVAVQPGALLAIEGSLGMPAPTNAMLRFRLADDGAGSTKLRVTHRAIGRLTQEVINEYVTGWEDLVRTRLKPYVETGVRHGLGHPLPPATIERMKNSRP